MGAGPTLHHIGCVVDSIASRLGGYRATLQAATVSQVFEDPIQRSRVVFLASQGAPQFELIEPMTPDSPVARFSQTGGGLHHLCYEVDDLPAQIQSMKTRRALLIRAPKPAVAFGGRHIAWMRTPEGLLVEYLQR